MSRIFTFEAVQNKSVPSPEDFDSVLEYLRRCIPVLPHIVGAVVFGSSLTRNWRPTSDIDVFIAFDEPGMRVSEDSLNALNQISLWASRRHVAIDWLPNTQHQLAEDRHTIRAGGLDHIMWGAEHGGIIGNNPCPFVAHNGNRKNEARDYVLMAMDRLACRKAQWSILSEQEKNKVRSKALDRPVAAARRVLEMTDRQACASSSQQVVEALQDDTLNKISGLSRAYLELLNRQLLRPNERRYRAFLEQALDRQALALAHDFFARLLEKELA